MKTSTIAIPWPERTLLSLQGTDRTTFLHNLCTNDIKQLEPGQGCEAFVTNVQGKTIGHVIVGCQEEQLLLTTVPAQAKTLLKHLDRYLITEDVVLSDESTEYSQTLLSGPEASEILKRAFCIDTADDILTTQHRDQTLIVWGMPFTGDETFSVLQRSADANLVELLVAAGAERGAVEELERRRIENRFPWFGRDLTDANLPQELDRNAQAISFTKGCYLGQETVARIDALGHVNKLLVRIHSETELPVGAELYVGEKRVGSMTSGIATAESNLGLAYVKSKFAVPGVELTIASNQTASVV